MLVKEDLSRSSIILRIKLCSMLHWMESCGKLGHSSVVAFYSDGDGDFRPTFDIDREYKKAEGLWKELDNQLPVPEVIFDAG